MTPTTYLVSTLFAVRGDDPNMSTDSPRAEDLRRGMTVEIVQDEQDEPIIGDIQTVRTDEGREPDGGPRVKLESGAVGNVTQIVPDE